MVISGTVAVAGTAAEARRLLVPEAWSMAYSRTHGTFPPLAPAEAVEARTMTARERDLYEAGLAGHIAGTEEQVAHELETVLKGDGRRGGARHHQHLRPYGPAGLHRRLARLFAPGR